MNDVSDTVKIAAEGDSAPRIFLSHASKDKSRFVLPLDDALTQRGLKVWLDQREIRLGDNLVDRIFDQGIGSADYVVIVLSNNTDESDFVHKELTTAVVSRITNRIKAIFPILLDGVEVPAALRDTKYLEADSSMVDQAADEIRDAVFGTAVPPIAPRPAYTQLPVHQFSGLNADDERVLAIAAELYLDAPRWHPVVETIDILARTRAISMSDNVALESLEILGDSIYVTDQQWENGTMSPISIKLSNFAITTFLQSYRPREYRRAQRAIVAAIVNGETELNPILESRAISEPLGIAILEELQDARKLRFDMDSYGTYISSSAALTRHLRELDVED